MAKLPSRDLFDDSSMSFGEHLEALRAHLIKALAGLIIAVLVAFAIGDYVVVFLSQPINDALRAYDIQQVAVHDDLKGFNFVDWFKRQLGLRVGDPLPDPIPQALRDEIEVAVLPSELAAILHQTDPQRFPAASNLAANPASPANDTAAATRPEANGQQTRDNASNSAVKKVVPEKPLMLRMRSPVFAELRATADRTLRPVALNVQEPFMTYLKVTFITGVVLASPWLFYQAWLFVAAGLYPHERKYVHIYLPVSLGLFFGGALFCYYLVMPFVLDFLLGFNAKLQIAPQIRLSEWISFVLMLPLMFGLSFQLPLVMLFLERINVFDVHTYRSKFRIAILVISILSMLLTPSADPMSMLLMMGPLIALYGVGIWLCSMNATKPSPFSEAA